MTAEPREPSGLPTHIGFEVKARYPDGADEATRDALWNRIQLAVCETDEDHDGCPLVTMASCHGSAEDVDFWFMRSWNAIEAVQAIRPEDHATKSRDYGRGFADAIQRVRQVIKEQTTRQKESDHA